MGSQEGSSSRPTYQVCGNHGHDALHYCNLFDDSNQFEEPRVAAAALSSYNNDTNWYADTSDLDRLTVRERYKGGDQVQVANGARLSICHVGQSIVTSSPRLLLLNDVLHFHISAKTYFLSKS